MNVYKNIVENTDEIKVYQILKSKEVLLREDEMNENLKGVFTRGLNKRRALKFRSDYKIEFLQDGRNQGVLLIRDSKENGYEF